MNEITWGEWFGSFATAAAAKRYLTMTFTGPKVGDRGRWAADLRQATDGTWQVRLGEKPFISALFPEVTA